MRQAAYFFRTPSSETPSPHFIFDTQRRSSLGATPCVIGVANSAARYREDRSVRIHDTPFEQRCAGGAGMGYMARGQASCCCVAACWRPVKLAVDLTSFLLPCLKVDSKCGIYRVTGVLECLDL